MRYSVAVAALCAVPALAGEYPKYYDHKDFTIETFHEDIYEGPGHHFPRPPRPYPPHPVKPHLEHYEKLTEKIVCEKLHFFAAEADYIYELVKATECPERHPRCWEPVRKALYELEWELDLFDTKIDKSDLTKCWDCRQEGKIACCYRDYAEAIIRLLKLIKYKTEFLEGGTDKFILTAVNSLRAADYTYVYELVRRMSCQKFEKEIMQQQGAVDGSTPGSIRAAFAEFVFTPYITGNQFAGPIKPPGQEGTVPHIPIYKPEPYYEGPPPPPPHHPAPPPPQHPAPPPPPPPPQHPAPPPPPPPHHGPEYPHHDHHKVYVCPDGKCTGGLQH